MLPCRDGVAPYSTLNYSLDSMMGELPLPIPYCSIRIQYSGAPGSALAQVSSVEVKSDMVIDAAVANEGDGWHGSGANPWHLDKETESIVFLTDEGDKPARIGFSVTAGGVHYYLATLKLAPHETRTIDIRKLRDAQQPDFKNNKIPGDAADGSVSWIRLDNVAVSGRLVVLQRHRGIASSYDCCSCECPASYQYLSIEPNGWTTVPGYNGQLGAYEDMADCNNNYFFNVSEQTTWSSDDTSVVAVNGGVISPLGGGTANIVATKSDYYYTINEYGSCQANAVSYSDYATITVQVPTRYAHVSTPCTPSGGVGPLEIVIHGSVYGCNGGVVASNFCGLYRNLTYDLVDQNGEAVNLVAYVDYQVTESFSNFTSTIPGDSTPSPQTSTISAGSHAYDLQAVGFSSGLCLASNDHDSMSQQFSISIGQSIFPLTTVVTISRGNFSGTGKVDAIITTP